VLKLEQFITHGGAPAPILDALWIIALPYQQYALPKARLARENPNLSVRSRQCFMRDAAQPMAISEN